MALVLADRIKETTTTTGTGTYTLAGAETGFESFSSIGDGNTTYYCCTDGVDFEVGIGTYTATGTTLARTTILQSSNSDAAVNWSAGTRFIFVTQPAEKAVFLDASNNIDLGDSEKLIFGADSDFQIYHNGTNGYLQESTNAIVYRSAFHSFRNAADTEQLAKFVENGDVELYFNNVERLSTTDSGAKTFGQHFIENESGYGALEIGGTSGAFLDLKSPNSDDYDFRIITTGTSTAMWSIGGELTIKASGNENMARFVPNDATYLYFNNTPRIQTSNTGAEVTGTLVADGLDIARDTEASAEIGRAHVGFMGWNDMAGFSHVDRNSQTEYSLLQDSNGTTYLNAASGQTISHRINNSPVMQMGSSGLDITGDLTLTSTDGGATENPTLDLYRNSASPADNDTLGHITFSGENSAGEKIVYGEIETQIADQTDGTEDSRVRISGLSSGTLLSYYEAKFGINTFLRDVFLDTGRNIVFEGSTNNDFETTLTVTDPTADRTITLPDATGTVLLADGDGSSLTNVNATTLDSIDSTSFLRSDAADTKTSGDLTFNDNVSAKFGTGGDLSIYHNSANSYIDNTIGSLYIRDNGFGAIYLQPTSGENSGTFNANGAVLLYYDNSKKFETTSTGASITGTLTVNSDTTLGAATHRNWDDIDTDIDGLIGGSTFGNIIEGQDSGHFVLGIRENDISDGLRIISGGGNYTSDDTYDTVIASFMSGGNVGIGTTTPSQKLEVNGTIKIPTGGETGTRLQVGDDIAIFDDGNAHIHSLAGNLWINAADGTSDVRLNNQENGNVILTNGTGKVGIGTTSPSDKLTVNGSFSATTKSFDIEHPTKEGYRLRYGSLEGAENGVYYRGETDLDYIELPDHWVGLVDEKSITVQLTPKGKFQQLFVKDIEDSTVLVDGVEGDYYFVVFAERKDVDKLVVEYEG